jgi:hypothetical protein
VTCTATSFGVRCTLDAGHDGDFHQHEDDGDGRYAVWMTLPDEGRLAVHAPAAMPPGIPSGMSAYFTDHSVLGGDT